MGPRLHRQILAGTEVNDFGAQRILVHHYVVWLQVSMEDAQLFIKILHASQDLLGQDANLSHLVELHAFPCPSLDELSEAHVHHLEDDIQPLIVKLDFVSFHDVRAMAKANAAG